MTPSEIQAYVNLGLNGVLLIIVVVLWRHVLALNAKIDRMYVKLEDLYEKANANSAMFKVHDIINTSD